MSSSLLDRLEHTVKRGLVVTQHAHVHDSLKSLILLLSVEMHMQVIVSGSSGDNIVLKGLRDLFARHTQPNHALLQYPVLTA